MFIFSSKSKRTIKTLPQTPAWTSGNSEVYGKYGLDFPKACQGISYQPSSPWSHSFLINSGFRINITNVKMYTIKMGILHFRRLYLFSVVEKEEHNSLNKWQQMRICAVSSFYICVWGDYLYWPGSCSFFRLLEQNTELLHAYEGLTRWISISSEHHTQVWNSQINTQFRSNPYVKKCFDWLLTRYITTTSAFSVLHKSLWAAFLEH